jgi:ankyrin repeat protein
MVLDASTVRKIAGASTVSEFRELHAAVDSEAFASFVDSEGNSSLHLAAAHGQAPVVDAVIEAVGEGAARMKNEAGKTPLDLAVDRSDDSEVFGVFLTRGVACASGKVSGEVYIVHCSMKGNVNSVQALLDAGADPNSKTQDGVPLLFMISAMVAMKRQSEADTAKQLEEIMGVLLKGGASPDVQGPGGFTALHVAGEIGNVDMIAKLVEHGADRGVKNIENKTPTDIAAEWGHLEAVAYLMSGKRAEGNKEVEAAANALIEERSKATQGAGVKTNLIPGPEDPSEEKYLTCKQEGNKAFVKGDFARAFALYAQGLRHKTDDSTLWANAAAAALRSDAPEDAMRHARMARTVDKANVKAWYREGQAAQRLKQWEDAAAAYYEAFLINNEQTDASKRVADIDFAALVKECVEQGRAEHLKR